MSNSISNVSNLWSRALNILRNSFTREADMGLVNRKYKVPNDGCDVSTAAKHPRSISTSAVPPFDPIFLARTYWSLVTCHVFDKGLVDFLRLMPARNLKADKCWLVPVERHK